MTRAEELQELNAIVTTLCKRYNVTMTVAFQDLSLTENKMSDQEQLPVDADVVETPAEAFSDAPAESVEAAQVA